MNRRELFKRALFAYGGILAGPLVNAVSAVIPTPIAAIKMCSTRTFQSMLEEYLTNELLLESLLDNKYILLPFNEKEIS